MNAAARAADQALGKAETATPTSPQTDSSKTMSAVVWAGKKSVEVRTVPRPQLTEPRDVIIKITATTICGSDLHLYKNTMPNMKDGDILGHEFMGVVEEVGSSVKRLQKGQRVVVAFAIACGECEFCQREEYTACDETNSSKLQEKMYGDRTAALFGYSHMTGGVPGGQAEYARVPFADINCLVVPDDVPDEKALFLSDVIPTSYHGTELAGVKEGDTVAIWGLGPIGLLAARWCQIRGAKKVVGIDKVPDRLQKAREVLQLDTIDFSSEDTYQALRERFPNGVDCAIECAGFDYTNSLLHKAEIAVGMETDTSEILTQMIYSVRKFGRIAVIGVYSGFANHFPVGAMMEKDLKIACGQAPVVKYWKMCLEKLQSGELDSDFIVTNKGRLSDAPNLYKQFCDKEDGVIKVFLRP